MQKLYHNICSIATEGVIIAMTRFWVSFCVAWRKSVMQKAGPLRVVP